MWSAQRQDYNWIGNRKQRTKSRSPKRRAFTAHDRRAPAWSHRRLAGVYNIIKTNYQNDLNSHWWLFKWASSWSKRNSEDWVFSLESKTSLRSKWHWAFIRTLRGIQQAFGGNNRGMFVFFLFQNKKTETLFGKSCFGFQCLNNRQPMCSFECLS